MGSNQFLVNITPNNAQIKLTVIEGPSIDESFNFSESMVTQFCQISIGRKESN